MSHFIKTRLSPIESTSRQLDLCMMAGRDGEMLVARKQRSAELFSKSDVDGVMGGEIFSQIPHVRQVVGIRTRMPGGVGGAKSRDFPLSRLTGSTRSPNSPPRDEGHAAMPCCIRRPTLLAVVMSGDATYALGRLGIGLRLAHRNRKGS